VSSWLRTMIQLLRKCLYIFQLKVIPQSVKNLVLCGYWNHINLQEVFNALQDHGIRLNSDKCAFGVERRKFLGFILTYRGIEANLENFRATLKCEALKILKKSRSWSTSWWHYQDLCLSWQKTKNRSSSYWDTQQNSSGRLNVKIFSFT